MFINRWKDKEDVVHIYAREYYSAINKEILPSATIRMELEGIMLSENSLTEKDKYYMVLLICGIWKLHKLASIYIKKRLRYRKQTSDYHEEKRSREWQTTSVFLPWEPMSKKQKWINFCCKQNKTKQKNTQELESQIQKTNWCLSEQGWAKTWGRLRGTNFQV